MSKRPNLPRHAWAMGLAVCAHLLTLLLLGWRIPRVAEPDLAGDHSLPIEVTLVRPEATPRAPPEATSPRQAPSSPTPLARVLVAPTPGAPALSAPEQAPPQASVQARDCAPEDLLLLTDAERAFCRNAVDADKERRLARGADDRIAKQVAEGDRWQNIFRENADREAYDDALTQTLAKQNGAPATVGHGLGVGVTCSQMTFPLLSGVDINPNLFAKKHMEEHPSKGSKHCSAAIGGVR